METLVSLVLAGILCSTNQFSDCGDNIHDAYEQATKELPAVETSPFEQTLSTPAVENVVDKTV